METVLERPANGQDLGALACCPRCRADLRPGAESWRCSAVDCVYYASGFPVASGQPVLVDFERSIFRRTDYQRDTGSVLPRDDTGRGLLTRVRAAVLGHNPVAARMSHALLELVHALAPQPMVLVVGGGAIGSGVSALYGDPNVRIVGTDVYVSANTSLAADGHALPFRDATFDAVVVQAVLEHVLEPERVVNEIHRVLRPGGLVYADTPFMQQVHEAAYDFTRFTRSGHRWLFRRFAEIEAGSVNGAGTVLLWSIRYYVRAFGMGNKVAMLATASFAWLRLLERFMRPRLNADAASGHYFLGRRSDTQAIAETDMLAYYERQRTQATRKASRPMAGGVRA